MADLTSLVFRYLQVPLYKARQPLRLQDEATQPLTRQGFSKQAMPLPTGFYLFSGCGRDCVDILSHSCLIRFLVHFCSRFEFLVLVLPFISCF